MDVDGEVGWVLGIGTRMLDEDGKRRRQMCNRRHCEYHMIRSRREVRLERDPKRSYTVFPAYMYCNTYCMPEPVRMLPMAHLRLICMLNHET